MIYLGKGGGIARFFGKDLLEMMDDLFVSHV
jgi:hypothetical protein